MTDRRPSFLRSLLSSAGSAAGAPRRRSAARTSAQGPLPAPSETPNTATPTAVTTSPTRPMAEPTMPIPPEAPAVDLSHDKSPAPPPPPSPSKKQDDKPKTSLPSSGTTPSPPTRRTAQSRSPQVRSTPSSPSRMKGTQPRSPAHSAKAAITGSPNGVKPFSSPTKESRTPSQQVSTSLEAPNPTHTNGGTKLAASQQEEEEEEEEEESQNKADEIKADNIDHLKTSPKHIVADAQPSTDHAKPTPDANEKQKSPMKLDEKPDDIQQVKQVVPEQTGYNAAAEMEKEATEPQVANKVEVPKLKIMQTEKEQYMKQNPCADMKRANNTTNPPKKRTKEIKDVPSSFIKQTSSEDLKTNRHTSVITLAGENKGASMQIGSSSMPIHIHRGYKINPKESPAHAARDESGTTENASSTQDRPEAYVNNNSQLINNSIVFKSSMTEQNPGVHMVVSHIPQKAAMSENKTPRADARKAEFSTTQIAKLTYEPTVRRRCLRGLMLEPSDDSNADDPDKPRRHGCRVAFRGSSKGSIDVEGTTEHEDHV